MDIQNEGLLYFLRLSGIAGPAGQWGAEPDGWTPY